MYLYSKMETKFGDIVRKSHNEEKLQELRLYE